MNYIYSRVLELQEKPKVGSKECVALLQHYSSGIGPTGIWTEGEPVYGNIEIVPGTAIATFVNGRYHSNTTRNHAAYFIEQGVHGFWVMDQWRDDVKKPHISKRFIKTAGKKMANGSFPNASNNAYAYSIIER